MVASSAPGSWTIPHVRQVHGFKISIVKQHDSPRSTLSPRMISEGSLKFRQRNEKREIPALRLVCASFLPGAQTGVIWPMPVSFLFVLLLDSVKLKLPGVLPPNRLRGLFQKSQLK